MDEVPFLIKDVYDAVAWAGNRVVPGRILKGESYKNKTANLLDVKWCITLRKIGIGKRSQRRKHVEAGGICGDGSVVEVGESQIFPATLGSQDGESFIDCAGG